VGVPYLPEDVIMTVVELFIRYFSLIGVDITLQSIVANG
jgi:hypothetical protein